VAELRVFQATLTHTLRMQRGPVEQAARPSYGDDILPLWAWDNGDLPIWMTFDAIEALRLTDLAVAALPTWHPPL
jgi:hypothetical protein